MLVNDSAKMFAFIAISMKSQLLTGLMYQLFDLLKLVKKISGLFMKMEVFENKNCSEVPALDFLLDISVWLKYLTFFTIKICNLGLQKNIHFNDETERWSLTARNVNLENKAQCFIVTVIAQMLKRKSTWFIKTQLRSQSSHSWEENLSPNR